MADQNATNGTSKTPEEVAKENDLLPKLVTHLDRHLIFPLLQFVADQEEDPAPEITKAKYELLKKTNMTDYVASLYCEMNNLEEPPKEFATKRQEILDRLEQFNQESEKITDLLGREDVVGSLRSDKVANLEFLKKEHGTACPWILRYLTAAVITNRSRTRNTGQYQKQLKDVVRIVKQENYEYSDPVTDFVKALYIDFDFEEAQKKLSEAEEVLRSDFFLVSASDAFVEAARHLISESYCKIHQRIDIKDLSARLGLSQDEGEKWIVNLIRDTRVDAKIDYKEGTVVMNHPPSSVYQQVIERTKGGFFRTQVLSAAVAK
ncbi:hypothetical protein DH86_00002057 [Scytalidium sp. 3C]|nr:hypothetical protein DH86_00002057 [Scytalidium sp. 3C]